jgi:translocator protein
LNFLKNNISNEIGRLVSSIVIVLLVGLLGSLVTTPELTTWYVALTKPAWTPPNTWFGPIWTTLYILMGIALYLVWREGLTHKKVKLAILVFAVQLLLNFLWSVVFFSLHSLLGGLILIIALWISILANIIVFYRINRPAGLILIPYLVWVSIATNLNYSVYLLNP